VEKSGFNQPKTLSGIETSPLALIVPVMVIASTNPKPFQGLKPLINPLNGDRRGFNQPKTLSGIETYWFRADRLSCFKLQPTQNPFRD